MILKLIQEGAFGPDIKSIKTSCLNENNQQHASQKNKIQQNLKPFVDENDIVRVGGRLQNSPLGIELIHPFILPKTGSTSAINARDYHDTAAHVARSATMQRIRRIDYWIINSNAPVHRVIFNYIRCGSMRGKVGEQMVDLPKDRLNESLLFTYCGVDLIEPFFMKERRSKLKEYKVLFTCLVSRAVHIEFVATMETDSFIMAL